MCTAQLPHVFKAIMLQRGLVLTKSAPQHRSQTQMGSEITQPPPFLQIYKYAFTISRTTVSYIGQGRRNTAFSRDSRVTQTVKNCKLHKIKPSRELHFFVVVSGWGFSLDVQSRGKWNVWENIFTNPVRQNLGREKTRLHHTFVCDVRANYADLPPPRPFLLEQHNAVQALVYCQ